MSSLASFHIVGGGGVMVHVTGGGGGVDSHACNVNI